MKKKLFLISLLSTPVIAPAETLPNLNEGMQVVSLENCFEEGMKSYVPIKLANEELELARIKRQEAMRAYYPALSMKGEQTDGDTTGTTLGFTERVYGASLSQTIFEGGRVHASYRQAQASYGAAEMSREKTIQDFIYSVREAYWSLVAARENLRGREASQEILKEDLRKITEQYVLDLTVKQQFLAVKAQYLQSNNQLNQLRKTYSKARWELAKALGRQTPIEGPLVTTIPYQKKEIDLENCLMLAGINRPDLRMQNHLVEIARQGKTVAGAASWPEVSFNSFYGRSASAFVDTDLDYKEDWQFNVNVAQKFWGNTVGVSKGETNTSPKVGESTRTKTKTKGVHLNVLDGMKNRTELKQSDLNYRQAELKQDDLKKDIAMEVEAAFYSVNQATLQVEFSDEDLKLAEEELKIAESKGRYGIAGVLDIAQARNRLTQARAAKLDAAAGYQIALAALNRAIGIPHKFETQ